MDQLSLNAVDGPMDRLRRAGIAGDLDEPLIPYLKRLCSYPFMVTTSSCVGHMVWPTNRKPTHLWGYVDFLATINFHRYVLAAGISYQSWLHQEASILILHEVPNYAKRDTMGTRLAWRKEDWPKPLNWLLMVAEQYNKEETENDHRRRSITPFTRDGAAQGKDQNRIGAGRD